MKPPPSVPRTSETMAATMKPPPTNSQKDNQNPRNRIMSRFRFAGMIMRRPSASSTMVERGLAGVTLTAMPLLLNIAYVLGLIVIHHRRPQRLDDSAVLSRVDG